MTQRYRGDYGRKRGYANDRFYEDPLYAPPPKSQKSDVPAPAPSSPLKPATDTTQART